jgi:hypothetical protein
MPTLGWTIKLSGGGFAYKLLLNLQATEWIVLASQGLTGALMPINRATAKASSVWRSIMANQDPPLTFARPLTDVVDSRPGIRPG